MNIQYLKIPGAVFSNIALQQKANNIPKTLDFSRWVADSFSTVENFSEINEEVAQGYAQFLWSERKVSERTYKDSGFNLPCSYTQEVNPFAKENIARKNENQQGHKKFTEDEILNILDCFNNPDLYLLHKDEMKVLLHIGALTGLRLADCCLLKWDNVSFQNDLIKCIPRKTRKIKRVAIIPIFSKLEEQLKVAIEWKTDDNYILPKVAERYLRNLDGIRGGSSKVFKFSG